uniref:Uncharacterized protein n=1 Tax=Arundo donax TaxID=35708 RepID=A0A0A8Z3P8_ARUDO
MRWLVSIHGADPILTRICACMLLCGVHQWQRQVRDA